MTKLNKLGGRFGGISREEARQLCELANIHTVEDLWDRISSDTEQGQGIDQLATKAQISPSRLTDLLICEATRTGLRGWFRRQLLVLLIGVGVVVLTVLALRALGALDVVAFEQFGSPVIIATRELPAFTLIGEGDVTRTTMLAPPAGAVADPGKVIKKMTKAPVKNKVVLTESVVFDPPQSIKGWGLVTFPFTSTLALDPGKVVTVIGASGDPPQPKTISETAIVIGTQGKLITVALMSEQAKVAAAYLTENHQLRILESVP